jgi:hypothetical protein
LDKKAQRGEPVDSPRFVFPAAAVLAAGCFLAEDALIFTAGAAKSFASERRGDGT